MEAGIEPIFSQGKQVALRDLARARRGFVRQLQRIRKRLGGRADRVVARAMGDRFGQDFRDLYPTETGAGFGWIESAADIRKANYRFRAIFTHCLTWHEAALVVSYIEAVITQKPGRHEWLSLPFPRTELPWETRVLEAGLITAEGEAVSGQTAEERDHAIASYFKSMPQQWGDPYSQIKAFLADCCEVHKPGSKSYSEAETDFAALQTALENWLILRGIMPPSAKFFGGDLLDMGFGRRMSNGRTLYKGIALKPGMPAETDLPI